MIYLILNTTALVLTVVFAVYAFRVFKDLDATMEANDALLAEMSEALESERTRLTLEGVL